MELTLGFFLRGAGHEDSAPGSIATELRRSVGCREFLALGDRGSSGRSLFVSKIIGFVPALLKILTRMCTTGEVRGLTFHPILRYLIFLCAVHFRLSRSSPQGRYGSLPLSSPSLLRKFCLPMTGRNGAARIGTASRRRPVGRLNGLQHPRNFGRPMWEWDIPRARSSMAGSTRWG